MKRIYNTQPTMKYKSEELRYPLAHSIRDRDNDFHTLMLHDHIRMKTYEEGIKSSIKPGMTVADIGTGTGILAQWALEAGAAKVYCIEFNPLRIAQAKKRLTDAGFGGKFTIFNTLSYDTMLPEKVDVVISEILGNLGDNEDMTIILQDARRFLKPTGKFLPEKVTTNLVPIDSQALHMQVKDKTYKAINQHYDLSALLQKLGCTKFDIAYDAIIPRNKHLATTGAMCHFHFDSTDQTACSIHHTFTVKKDGIFTGFKGWFVATIGNHTLDIGGCDIQKRQTSDCRKHAYLPIKDTIPVHKGDTIAITYSRQQNNKRSLMQSYSRKGYVQKHNGSIIYF